jgi:tetratricopeptide (TPR) repeat protein
MKSTLLFITSFFFYSHILAQTITMNKSCREKNQAGINQLKEKKYEDALQAFSQMEKSCNTKDAKEAWGVGKAEALNGLKRYEDAITESDKALKVTKGKSLMALFQKAIAQNGLKQYDAASSTFAQMMNLTEKNQDTKARASNYALMASVQSHQLAKPDSGHYYIEKAITMQPDNPDFIVQKGDIYFDEKKYDAAFTQYDKAVQMGKNDYEMYTIRSNARLKMLQDKYGTTNVQELRSKMTAEEKQLLCTDLKKAISFGQKDMQQDMVASLICK